ncbi:hypothetical protein OXB_2615 [Bacillus sp. OxB-1]|uniref:bacterial transcriptional activator domain-containing protein n=1 Tax=Bacillus sp. (strain OxB-1) TaxID=98228 RepID=UPI000581D291|nr:bacterial transcriptional activator domain-containing protein [Bacillus sp. OxB-1]BAQ11086.1 hypothetical protein OXB_2615 [Bacillus sp. OxB-1]
MAIATTVVAYGSTLIQSGQFEWILEIINELSAATQDEFYPLHYYAGEAYRYRASYETAQASYVECMKIAEQHEDFYFISRANAGIAHIYLDTIQPGIAESYLSQAIHFAQASKRTSSQEMQMLKRQFAENLVNLAQSYTRLREFQKTAYWAEKILRIDRTWEEAHRLLMYAHYQLQNRSQSVKWYQKCKKVLEEEFAIMPMETTEQMYKMIVNEL